MYLCQVTQIPVTHSRPGPLRRGLLPNDARILPNFRIDPLSRYVYYFFTPHYLHVGKFSENQTHLISIFYTLLLTNVHKFIMRFELPCWEYTNHLPSMTGLNKTRGLVGQDAKFFNELNKPTSDSSMELGEYASFTLNSPTLTSTFTE